MAGLNKKKMVEKNKKSQIQGVSFSYGNKTIASLKKNQLDNYDELESYKNLRKKRKRLAVMRMFVWLLVVLCVPLFVFFSIIIVSPNSGHDFFGYKLFIVASGSMKPDIDINDCIIVKKVRSREDVKLYDDITFIRSSDGEVVTHQIIGEYVNSDGVTEYVTKGKHNATADEERVTFENIIGVRIKTVGWLGQTIMFFRTSYGIITLMGILVFILGSFYVSFAISNDIHSIGKQ